jgi:CO dehydrogenase/acetyl-CoA synthase delta subunit
MLTLLESEMPTLMKMAGVLQSEVSEQGNFQCLLNTVKFNHDVDSIANAVLMYDHLLLEFSKTAIETYVS